MYQNALFVVLIRFLCEQIHANIVLSQEVLDYAPLFAEIADAYFERELYAEARPIYELLGTDAGVCKAKFIVHKFV